MKWFERMEMLREQRGWNLAELARRSGVSYDNLTKYAKGTVQMPRGDAMERIAQTFGLTEQELVFGSTGGTKLGIATGKVLPDYDRSGSQNGTKRIPHLTLSELAQHQAGHDLFNVWSGEMNIIVDEKIRSNCIAVTVEDNSMLPEFKPGDILICDPDADIEPGNYVIAKVDGQPKAVFRKYRLSKGQMPGVSRVELKPLNEDYPEEYIDEGHPGHIIGRCFKVMKDI